MSPHRDTILKQTEPTTEWGWYCEPAGSFEPLTEAMTRCDTYGEAKGTDRHRHCGEIEVTHPGEVHYADGTIIAYTGDQPPPRRQPAAPGEVWLARGE